MHDGITKFGKEYNGTYLRGVDCETYKLFNLPYCLTNVPGAMNSYLLRDILIETIAPFSNVENSAHSVINNEIERPVPERNNDFQKTLPNYFELGKLERLAIENKEIIIAVQNSPVGICGDGGSYNNKAARLLSELYGFQCPTYRCPAHICGGTVKILARSKAMSVVEIKEYYEALSPIVRNFSYSMKNKESLDQAMKMLQMTPFRLLSWCATCMYHFLDARVICDSLIPLYNTFVSCNVNTEARDRFFNIKNIKA